jgi:hypothetical protein
LPWDVQPSPDPGEETGAPARSDRVGPEPGVPSVDFFCADDVPIAAAGAGFDCGVAGFNAVSV